MSQEKSIKRILILGGTCDLAKHLVESILNNSSCINYIDSEEDLSTPLKMTDDRYNLFLTYRNEAKMKEFSKEMPKRVKWIFCDFASEVDFPEVDILIDLAHTDLQGLLLSLNDEEVANYWNRMLIYRQKYLKQITHKMLEQRSGRLVYISSTAASLLNSGQGMYSTAKVAIENLYKCYGIELAKKNITTVSLRLGYFDSGRGKDFIHNNKELRKRIPTRKFIELIDIVQTIKFLISDSAKMINATTITMDGGLTATK